MILICGATGDLGSAITRMLLAQTTKVRILARSGSNFQPLVDAGAEVVFGDLKEPRYAGCRLPGRRDGVDNRQLAARRGGADNPQSVDLEGNRNLIQAARDAGVKHFIFISALIADPNSPVPFLAAKGQTEGTLKASGMDYTILAPDSFMEYWIAGIVGAPALSGQPVPVVGGGSRRHSFISAVDVARFAVSAVVHPAARNQKLFLGGPQAISYQETIQVFERILSRPVKILRLQPGDPVPDLPPEVGGLLAAMETFDTQVPMDESARTYNVRMTSLQEFAQKLVDSVPG